MCHSPIKAQWISRTRKDEAVLPSDFAQNMQISSRLASMLWTRGLTEKNEVDFFLSPHLRYLEQPHKWPDINKAANLIVDALLQNKKFLVWGDYDVDGVTGVSIALDVLHYYGFQPLWHLPTREGEGYGLNSETLRKFAEDGVEIIMTVDCGISDVAEVQSALDLGMTVIISDHHLSPDILPNAHALCNPRLADCPCQSLAGVGVAFFLMAEVNTLLFTRLKMNQNDLIKFDMRNCLDLVALGTLADMVSLEGQNRILVKNGLLKITEAKRLGLAALKSVSKHNVHDPLTSRQIVFSVAPRINAAGRMASAKLAVELFMEKDKTKALELAEKLDFYNDKRKKEEKAITETALTLGASQEESPVLFVRQEDWNQGIVGIVASRLVEQFHKPSFVFTKDGAEWKASARSVPHFDLHAGLCACSHLLSSYGGHKAAAGLRVTEENYVAFTKAFSEFFLNNTGIEAQEKTIITDGELSFVEALDANFRSEVDQMQPFGIGNPEPIFSSPPLLVKGLAVFGAQKNHVRLTLEDTVSQVNLTIKIWSKAHQYPKEMQGQRIEIVYTLNLETTNASLNDYIKMKDWRYSV